MNKYTMIYNSSTFGQSDRTFMATSLEDAEQQAAAWLAMPLHGHPDEERELIHVGLGIL
jgi:hypothetical protein